MNSDAPEDEDALGERAIAVRLNQLREERGWSEREMARQLGVNANTLRPYLHDRTPKANQLARFARVLGVNLEWLATGTGPRERTPIESETLFLDRGLMREVIMRTWREIKQDKLRPTAEEFADLVLIRYASSIRARQE